LEQVADKTEQLPAHIHLINTELTYVFRTKRYHSLLKTMQIGLSILKMWTAKYSGLIFQPTLYIATNYSLSANI